VLGLISLISPLQYYGDFKPYFTIYEPSYRIIAEYCNKECISNIILGSTNPLFLRSLEKFPNILHLESEFRKKASKKKLG